MTSCSLLEKTAGELSIILDDLEKEFPGFFVVGNDGIVFHQIAEQEFIRVDISIKNSKLGDVSYCVDVHSTHDFIDIVFHITNIHRQYYATSLVSLRNFFRGCIDKAKQAEAA